MNMTLRDTAGMEMFDSITANYYRDADACVIVYDVTQFHTLDKAKHWAHEIENELGSKKTMQSSDSQILYLSFIIGNKIDIDEKEQTVSFNEGQELAD